jgi:uncharacterized surface protein with fasciclin (FAS1) repeats
VIEIPGKAVASDVVQLNGKSVTTVQGSPAAIKVPGKTRMIDAARVLKTDIPGAIGVIPIIDTVLSPPSS